MIAFLLMIWSLFSLPPTKRGKILVINGAFKYFRHPLYAALISFFNVGLAILLNNWIYLIWALIVHLLWHWNVRSEEELMEKIYADDYINYCKVTGRFVPMLVEM